MTTLAHPQDADPRLGVAIAFASSISLNFGAGLAKHLFPLVGAVGVTALRLSLAALLLGAILRPWRRLPPRRLLPALIGYGVVLGLMNLVFYQAIARIPIGIAIGIEVLGPITIAVVGSRTRRDFLWLAMAVVGLLALLPLRTNDPLDPVGVGFALAAAIGWGLYIVTGKHVSGTIGRDVVAWGLAVASIVTLPLGLATAGTLMFTPMALVTGVGIAILSGALPYTLEMEAMRRLPRPVFGMLMSASPAIGAAMGFLLLGETLSAIQGAALLCIIVAAAGSALTARGG